MPLPTLDEGMDAITNVNCITSKQIVLWATKKDINLEELTMEYLKHIIPHKGIPHKVISDRGSVFVLQFMKFLFNLLGIKANLSTVYHPQMDRQMERSNATVEHFLWLYINEQQMDWAYYLPLAATAYNNTPHLSIKCSPNMYNYGRDLYLETQLL